MPIALVAILVGGLAVVTFAVTVALARAAALGDAELERQARESLGPEVTVTRQRYRRSGSRGRGTVGSQPPT